MMESLSFTVFSQSDIPCIEQMVQELYTDDPSTEGMTTEKIRRTIGELSRYPEKGAFVVFRSGQTIVGYALLIHFWSNEYGGTIEVIDELCVRRAWREKGVASAFLEHISATPRTGVKGLLLEVTPRNARARALYTRHGFTTAKNEHLFKKLDT